MDFLDEEQLIFKRFPDEKQEQVRGLVNYATLMGLTGKDLVSIGGKLDRLKAARQKQHNLEIIKGFECLPIGQDRNRRNREDAFDERFKLQSAGSAYNFERSYDSWKITSVATKQTRNYKSIDEYAYDLGRVGWSRRSRYVLLLDIAAGKLQLNF